jgi:hypothetical protein
VRPCRTSARERAHLRQRDRAVARAVHDGVRWHRRHEGGALAAAAAAAADRLAVYEPLRQRLARVRHDALVHLPAALLGAEHDGGEGAEVGPREGDLVDGAALKPTLDGVINRMPPRPLAALGAAVTADNLHEGRVCDLLDASGRVSTARHRLTALSLDAKHPLLGVAHPRCPGQGRRCGI